MRVPQLQVGNGRLWAVPSVHFRLAFADEVNRACELPEIDAVAVELGPETAAAAAHWLKDLRLTQRSQQNRLPCMLALSKPNIRIRPSQRQAAEHLQRTAGKELHELPPELLRAALGFSELQVFYLSPTDSIVEALRCALELRLPAYGVDLEETAERRERPGLVRDPGTATSRLRDYVDQNAAFAEHQRDVEIDERREFAMAARLKTLLERHRNVLFVCGLAHWRRIVDLLSRPDLRAAPATEVAEIAIPDHFQRLIVHPTLAVQYLDTFPSLASDYERQRYPPGKRSGTIPELRAETHFETALRTTYDSYFGEEESKNRDRLAAAEWEAREAFEHLVRNLCTVRQTRAPDLLTTLAASQSTMSHRFCEKLTEVLMKIEWASPRDPQFSELQILAPAPTEPGAPQRFELSGPDGMRSRIFYVAPLPGRQGTFSVKIPWEWDLNPPPPVEQPRGGSNRERPGGFGNWETWPPTNNLLNALTARALRLASESKTNVRIEPFEGSLGDGIDMKVSLRAYTRGEDRIYVRRRPPNQIRSEDNDLEEFPIVWIFASPALEVKDWNFSSDSLLDYERHLPDRTRLRKVISDQGRKIVLAVLPSISDESVPELSQGPYQVQLQRRAGELYFNPDFTIRQTAYWAENTRYERNPILSRSVSFDSLAAHYKAKHHIELQGLPWSTALILIALPYARRSITLVAPDDFALPREVSLAAALKPVPVAIKRIPLSYFPRDAIEKVSQRHQMQTVAREKTGGLADDFPDYPEHILRFFGEPVTANYSLLPKRWRDYNLIGG